MPQPLQTAGAARRAPIPTGVSRWWSLPTGGCWQSRRWPGTGLPLVTLRRAVRLFARVGSTSPPPRGDRVSRLTCPGSGARGCPRTTALPAMRGISFARSTSWAWRSFSLVGHSLGGSVAAELSEQAHERARNLTLLAPAGFGPVPLAELLGGSAVGRLARLGVPLTLSNPLSAAGIYMAVVSHGHLPERQLLGRLIRRAFSTAPGAFAANEATVAAARDPDGFAHRSVRYDGPVSVLWGTSDVLIPVSHAARVCEALPQATLTCGRAWATIHSVSGPSSSMTTSRRYDTHAGDGGERRRLTGGRRQPGLPAGPDVSNWPEALPRAVNAYEVGRAFKRHPRTDPPDRTNRSRSSKASTKDLLEEDPAQAARRHARSAGSSEHDPPSARVRPSKHRRL